MRIFEYVLAGLILLAVPAQAGQARGGAPDAATDEYDRGSGDLNADAGIRANGLDTADLPRVNIQPTIAADGTAVAAPDANARLQAAARPAPAAATGDDPAALNQHNAPEAPGSAGSRGKVGLERSHGSGLN